MIDAASLLRSPRILGRAGITLLVVSGVILWLVFSRRPDAPPESLSELAPVAGTVESVSEQLRPSYTTKKGRRTVVHPAARQGLRLGLTSGAGQTSEWLIEEWVIDGGNGAPALLDELRPGTPVTAYARDGRIYQLEGPRGVLVDLEHARASRGWSSIAALSLLVLALVAGVVLCVRAALLWLGKSDGALPER